MVRSTAMIRPRSVCREACLYHHHDTIMAVIINLGHRPRGRLCTRELVLPGSLRASRGTCTAPGRPAAGEGRRQNEFANWVRFAY